MESEKNNAKQKNVRVKVVNKDNPKEEFITEIKEETFEDFPILRSGEEKVVYLDDSEYKTVRGRYVNKYTIMYKRQEIGTINLTETEVKDYAEFFKNTANDGSSELQLDAKDEYIEFLEKDESTYNKLIDKYRKPIKIKHISEKGETDYEGEIYLTQDDIGKNKNEFSLFLEQYGERINSDDKYSFCKIEDGCLVVNDKFMEDMQNDTLEVGSINNTNIDRKDMPTIIEEFDEPETFVLDNENDELGAEFGKNHIRKLDEGIGDIYNQVSDYQYGGENLPVKQNWKTKLSGFIDKVGNWALVKWIKGKIGKQGERLEHIDKTVSDGINIIGDAIESPFKYAARKLRRNLRVKVEEKGTKNENKNKGYTPQTYKNTGEYRR